MYPLPDCNLPWIDTHANTFATTISAAFPLPAILGGTDKSKFFQCCEAPGQCRFFTENEEPLLSCKGYGIIACAVGNSKYVCEFTRFPVTPTVTAGSAAKTPSTGDASQARDEEAMTCRQEGTLAITRSISCCPAKLSSLLANLQCTKRHGEGLDVPTCCKPGDDPNKCDASDTCQRQEWDFFSTVQGLRYTIYSGYIYPNTTEFGPSELACVEEVELGTPLAGNETCVPIEKSSCNLGGSPAGSPPPSPGPLISGNGKGSSNGGVSSMRKGKVYRGKGGFAKSVALLAFTPLLIQLLFL
ncbi:hypothetical protein BGZ90_004188 [Linnemannia elongata]|nr:hypothetical protein BGZ90_004188 [Linnemannia elongata]